MKWLKKIKSNEIIEYSFSASIMLIAIALLNGVTDINLITSIAVLTSSCQLCGLAVEFIKDKKNKMVNTFNWLVTILLGL